ncbi:hypothetical protein GDO86_017505 [Hymenochirus boettgeri]|uniref:Uncharacterized protein n=1 Tax=Hymenochirus boettgeri TaxID=247094 RepID=A0A8T2IJX4_9PIPI|nr:hypothetical protein GDO86_017505 [Hymenochirus boettgeri]
MYATILHMDCSYITVYRGHCCIDLLEQCSGATITREMLDHLCTERSQLHYIKAPALTICQMDVQQQERLIFINKGMFVANCLNFK